MSTFQEAASLYQQGRAPEAQALCEEIVRREPFNVGALHLLGLILYQAGDAKRGAGLIGQAVDLNPNDALVQSNLAAALTASGAFAKAIRAADAAIALNPQMARAHSNRDAAIINWAKSLKNDAAVALKTGRMDIAHDALTAALHLAPIDHDVRVSLGILQLQRGNYAEGFANYEARWESGWLNLPQRGFAPPQWSGEDIKGKTILLHNEQGYGDALQFARYAPLVAARGATVILEVEKALVPLLKQLPGVSATIARGDELPRLDVHAPLISLPFAFKTTLKNIPASPHYLKADPAKVAAWAARLGAKARRRIGLTWSGDAGQANDANRSIVLKDFAAALPPGFDYISLQKDVRPADLEALRARPDIRHFGDELKDFSDSAALCELTDEVITVCTSTAHLAGALGKPTTVLLCFDPCWRWLLERSDSPWYPSVSLIRQEKPGDWAGVLARVRDVVAGKGATTKF